MERVRAVRERVALSLLVIDTRLTTSLPVLLLEWCRYNGMRCDRTQP